MTEPLKYMSFLIKIIKKKIVFVIKPGNQVRDMVDLFISSSSKPLTTLGKLFSQVSNKKTSSLLTTEVIFAKYIHTHIKTHHTHTCAHSQIFHRGE